MENKRYLRGLVRTPDALVEWDDFNIYDHNPDDILIDGIHASFSKMGEAHGYNWKSSASGRELFFLRDDGKIFQIPMKFFRKDTKK